MYAVVMICEPMNVVETVIVCDDLEDALDRAVLLAADQGMLTDREDEVEISDVTRHLENFRHYRGRDVNIFVARAFRP